MTEKEEKELTNLYTAVTNGIQSALNGEDIKTNIFGDKINDSKAN